MASAANSSDQLGELDQATRPASVADLHPPDHSAVGPRVPGGIYRSGYSGTTYRVDEVLVGDRARAELAASPSDWAVAVTSLDGDMPGTRRVHCTAWDPRRDRVVRQPANLADALAADDAAEDRGMHPDDRRTCHTCQSWADHAHDPHTGAHITLHEHEARIARLGTAGTA